MSELDDLRNLTIETMDDIWSEWVRHFPLRASNADPAREQREFRAVLRAAGQKPETPEADFQVRVAGERAVANIDRRRVEGVAFEIGDKLRAIGRSNRPWFTVAGIEDRADDRLVLHLNQA